MTTGFRKYCRTLLAGSLLIGGLTAVSLAATTALTTGTASANTATLFSETTPGTYSVKVPGGVTSVTRRSVLKGLRRPRSLNLTRPPVCKWVGGQ